MQYSHSRIECFTTCQFKYRLRYLEGLLTLPPDNADNPLILGTAMHNGIEKGVTSAIHEYYGSYPIITDEHVTEAMILEYLIPKARDMLPAGGVFERMVSTPDYIGYVDYLLPTGNTNEYDLYDFKYSSNASRYRDSPQLHIYKHFLEQQGTKIRGMYYLFVPKVKAMQGKKETLADFRSRIQSELEKIEPTLIAIKFNYVKVVDFMLGIKHAQETTEHAKTQSYLCNWCDYKELCRKGTDYMLLPKNERRKIEKITKRAFWLYGAPFSGKTTFANHFPDPLMLNTDGNIKFVDSPIVAIKNDVSVEGRMTKTTFAWEIFKEAIAELETKQNDFKTIIVDLLEDLYEHCRLYMYREMGITHESDDSFRAWDKVTTEFLSTIRRLMNMDYENLILISHEDLSKDITRKSGDKITAVKPDLREKVANKIAGMVDVVARVVAEGDVHTLSFKTSEVIFGGGRLKVATTEIPLDYDEFIAVYDEANTDGGKPVETTKGKETKPETAADGKLPENDPPAALPSEPSGAGDESKPENSKPVRTRKRR